MPKHAKLVLLQPLMDEVATLSRSLNDPCAQHHELELELEAPTREIAKRLRVILSRSREEIKDFGGFYCIRLLLDQQSALASFFIDLFSHLEFLLLHLYAQLFERLSVQWLDQREELTRRSLNGSLPDLLCTTRICRLLYATCQMLPFSGQIADPEFKREGRRQGRQFSGNLLHCRMRHTASVYLDQPGCSRVNLLQKLGSGASATVYKGVFERLDCGHVKTGHFVAVKMFEDGEYMPGSSALGSNFGSKLLQTMQQMTDSLHSNDHKFLGELDKLVVAKHPNIVTPIGYIGERAEGKCGVVMELMDESLSDYLQKVNDGRVPPLKEPDMLDLMLEIARGMRFLHECELIHLDLKPQNVLLRFEDGNDQPPVVKLADLGLTTLLPFFQKEMLMGKGMPPLLGTSCYMAPELRGTSPENLRYDDKVDVFSYGTTCFNILVGNPDACAFSKSIPHFYEATRTGCWKQWVQGSNPFLVKLIGRCWEMDPSMRPTFATLCILLQQAIEWLMAPGYLPLATPECFDPASITKLKLLNNAKKLGHIQMYQAISAYYHRIQPVVGLEVIERCIMRFESHVRAKPDLLPRDAMQLSIKMAHGKPAQRWRRDDDRENGNQLVKDVSMFLQACRAKGSFNGVESRWKRILKGSHRSQRSLLESGAGHIETRMVDERCLDEADPLVFIKAQAYLELCEFLPTQYDRKSFGELGSSIQKAQQLYAVDLSGDDARVPLLVDSSLIPLLVSFWIARGLLKKLGASR